MFVKVVEFVEDSVLAKVVGFVENFDKREVKWLHKKEVVAISPIVEAAEVISST